MFVGLGPDPRCTENANLPARATVWATRAVCRRRFPDGKNAGTMCLPRVCRRRFRFPGFQRFAPPCLTAAAGSPTTTRDIGRRPGWGMPEDIKALRERYEQIALSGDERTTAC